MARIYLKILEIEDIELKQKRIEPHIFNRIYATVGYKAKDSFSYEEGLVDTGAIVSLLPKMVWKKLMVEPLGHHQIKGIVKKNECALPVMIAKVTCKLLDEFGNESSEFNSIVYCAESDDVPVILGLKGILDKLNLHILFDKNKAYLEEPRKSSH